MLPSRSSSEGSISRASSFHPSDTDEETDLRMSVEEVGRLDLDQWMVPHAAVELHPTSAEDLREKMRHRGDSQIRSGVSVVFDVWMPTIHELQDTILRRLFEDVWLQAVHILRKEHDGVLDAGPATFFTALVRCSQLREMSLHRFACTDYMWLYSLRFLEYLDLTRCTGISSLIYVQSEYMCNLRILCLRESDVGQRALVDLVKCDSLRQLDVTGCVNLVNLADLSNCASLTNLRVGGPSMSNTCLSDLGGCISLEILEIESPGGQLSIDFVDQLSQLSSLKLKCTALTDSSWIAIGKCPQLTQLSVSLPPRSGDAVLHLELNLRKLVTLTLVGVHLSADFVPRLAETCPLLRELELSEPLTEAGFTSLSTYQHHIQFRVAEVLAGEAEATSPQLETPRDGHVQGICKCATGEHVPMIDAVSRIVECGTLGRVETCIAGESMELLQYFDLAGVARCVCGTPHPEEVIKLLLDVRGVMVCDQAVTSADLAWLPLCKNAERVDLSGCIRISDVNSLAGIQQLASLNVTDTAVLAAGAEKVREERPDVTLIYKCACTNVDNCNILASVEQMKRAEPSGHIVTVEGTHVGLLPFFASESWPLCICGGARARNAAVLLRQIREAVIREGTAVTTPASLSWLQHCLHMEVVSLAGCRSLASVNVLKGLSNLREIAVNGSSLTADGIEQLSQCDGLEMVDFSGCSQLDDVSALSALQKLRSVNLMGTAVPYSSLSKLSGCPALVRLQWRGVVDLSYDDVSQEDMDFILRLNLATELRMVMAVPELGVWSTLGRLEQLNTLVMSGTDISEPHALASIAGLTHLRELVLNGCKTPTSSAGLTPMTALRSIDLRGTNFAADATMVRYLSQFPALLEVQWVSALDLSNSNIASEDLAVVRHFTGLADLNISGCNSVANCRGISSCSQLEVLRVANNSHVTAADFSALTSLPQLRVLDLSRCGSIREFAFLSSCEQLAVLRMRCTSHVTSAGLEALASLPRLRILDIGECGAIDRFEFLTQCAQLEELCMWGNKHVTSSNLETLASIRLVKVLDIGMCSAVRSVRFLDSCYGLEELNLYRNGHVKCIDLDEWLMEGNLSPAMRLLKVERCERLEAEKWNTGESALELRQCRPRLHIEVNW